MKKQWIFLFLFGSSMILTAQTVLISGTVIEKNTKEGIPNALVVAPNGQKALSDGQCDFTLQVDVLPVEIVTSAFGFEPKKIVVTKANKKVEMALESSSVVLQDALIVASKISEKQKQSPISVEALDLLSIREAAAPSFYEALGNMKGVDLTSASIGFKIINTRGFNSTSPVRSLQVIDGVDNQAPGLNFSLGNFLGAS